MFLGIQPRVKSHAAYATRGCIPTGLYHLSVGGVGVGGWDVGVRIK